MKLSLSTYICRTRVAQAQQQKRPLPPLLMLTSSVAVAGAHTSAQHQRRLMGARVCLNPSAAAALLGRVNTLPAAQTQTSRCSSAIFGVL